MAEEENNDKVKNDDKDKDKDDDEDKAALADHYSDAKDVDS
jgi:hypothetical protein